MKAMTQSEALEYLRERDSSKRYIVIEEGALPAGKSAGEGGEEVTAGKGEAEPTPPRNAQEVVVPDSATEPENLATVKRKLREVMKDNALERLEERRRSGKLSSRNLHEVLRTGRVFSKAERDGRKSYAVVLLTDCSGSMRGEEIACAGRASANLACLVEESAECTVLTYNARVTVAKSADERAVWSRIKEKIMTECYDGPAYGNHDGHAVREALRVLARSSAEKKVLIVLSDGQPACDEPSVCKGHKERKGCGHFVTQTRNNEVLSKELHKAVAQAKRDGVALFGVGIMTESVKEYYPRYTVIKKPEEIFPAVLAYLKRIIRRRA